MKTYSSFIKHLAEELSKDASSHEITKALKDKNSVDNRYKAALHHNVEKYHLDIMQKDRSSDVRAEVGRHPKASSEHIDKALSDKHPFVRHSALDHKNPTVKAHHVEKALKDSDHHVRALAIQHPTATEHHVRQALNDPHPHVRETATRVAKERNIKAD